ncbi:MAG: MerR family transcriptional regulator [Oscillospiraceae bacterium]|nr:MerR family transcriptional regulator [Oscillospiraceae bacterium]
MSKYTSGELAKLCGVSVRTVQYYDSRNILVPSALSEGGRRLYSEVDLKRMKIICFLREAGVPINKIGELFSEDHPEKVISLLLEQQQKALCHEITEGQKKLDIIENMARELKSIENFSVDSIADIAQIMKSKDKRRKMLWTMALTGIPLSVFQWVSIILWITNGLWSLFAIWLCAAIPWGIILSKHYHRHTSYICPECHEVFKPRFKEVFWSYHNIKMRRLTCPKCGRKGMCIELYEEINNG